MIFASISFAIDPFEVEESSGDPIGIAPPIKNVTIFNGQEYLDYPVDSFVYTETGKNTTSIRMKITNIYENSTKAFRLQLQSSASWFAPKEMEYSFDPDGFTKDEWPYWEVYPLEPNESIEVAFEVSAIIGSASLIDAKAETITRWSKSCKYPITEADDEIELSLEKYLFSLNYTGESKIYFTKNETNRTLVLALSDSELGVFRLNGTDVSVISDNDTIAAIVNEYIMTNSPDRTFNTSKPYELMKYSQNVSAGPERSCMIITGMDRNNCTNRESCFYSCFSVPVCSYIATGFDFIDTILSYKKSIDFANEKFNKSLDSSYEFKTDPAYFSAQAALTDLKELNKAETTVIFHPIFTTYNFCPPADYAIPQQMEARRILLDYINENCLYGEEEKIINQSLEFAALIKTLEENASVENISETPVINITINDTNITDMPAENQSIEKPECCASGACSIFGIEKIADVCWEWWTLFLLILIIGIFVILKRRKRK
jgi:hypothetical protein